MEELAPETMPAAAALLGLYLGPDGAADRPAEDLASRLRRFQATPGASILLARATGRPVGLLLLAPGASGSTGEPVLHVAALFVVPEARRRGVGTALLARAARIGASLRAHRLELITDAENTGARRLYAGLGFQWFPRKQVYMRFLPERGPGRA